MKKQLTALIAIVLTLWQCTPGPSYKRTQNGIELSTDTVNVKIGFYTNNSVRITKWDKNGTMDKPSLVVIAQPDTALNININETDSTIILASNTLQVAVNKSSGEVMFMNTSNNVILAEAGAQLTPVTFATDKGLTIQQNFKLTPHEGIYGFGQHQDGIVNYRGKQVTLVQTNTDAVNPFWVSTNGYGILWDNYSKTIFDDTEGKASMWSKLGDGIDYYFIAGENIDGAIAGYRHLTGQAPMYGKWAFGYWQSKEHYENRAELLSVAAEYRKRQIPIDNIIQDWDTWEGTENWNQLFFDAKKFPEPKEMMDILRSQNYHAIVSVWCSFGPNTAVYKEMGEKNYLLPAVGWAKFKYFDTYNPAANALYWDYLNKGFFEIGMDGWWMDSTEPDIINALTKGATEYELERMPNNHLGSFVRYLNPYTLMATESVYKNQRKTSEAQRAYILTRSTFAGQQRAAATTWSGDIGASWPIYKEQISAGINHCMSGIPYWTFDIGAFLLGSYGGVFDKGGKDPAYQELYTRMFQFGAFCPIFRSHGSDAPREMWEFGKFTDALVHATHLRYRLMPYIYTVGSQVTRNSYTMMRGLPMDFSADKATYGIDDQFMFGPSIMVCPVTEYMLHKPPMASTLVSPAHFKTVDGKQGLEAKYYKDMKRQVLGLETIDSCVNVNYYSTGRPDYVTDSTMAISWKGKLMVDETGPHQFHIKCFGPNKRIRINGKELKYTYTSTEAYTETINLEAGNAYDFEVEMENETPGALRVELFWRTPSMIAQEKTIEKREQSRKVYLPANTAWVDFWTGKTIAGGQTIVAQAPIDRIPLMVKAGAIIPMGPFVQYANEKPNEPLEIRVYPGTNGQFELYEDENDNYNYEKGVFSTIDFTWDDAQKQLTIGERKGTYPGMMEKRSFRIVMVSEKLGTGMATTSKPTKVIEYNGAKQTVAL